MIDNNKDDLGIKELNKMSCDTHVKRDSSERLLSIPKNLNNNTVLKEDKMKNTISETTRPNGVKVTLGSWEENGSVTYIVKSSNSFDTRFYGNYSSAANRFNELVEIANTEGGVK